MAVFARSWGLLFATWRVLRAEKSFVFFPILAAIVVLAPSSHCWW